MHFKQKLCMVEMSALLSLTICDERWWFDGSFFNLLDSFLAIRTFNSFAAEVEYHADMLLGFWDDLDISGYIYGCAIRADMGIGEETESGITDNFYYDLNSSIVTAHKLEHGEY